MKIGSECLLDKVIILTGVGRSGTSILGKCMGSTVNSYYLYEPAIAKYLFKIPTILFPAIRAVLFEDYFLPQVQCRLVNSNKSDESHIGNYWAGIDIFNRQAKLSSRKDAIAYLKHNPGNWIIKTLETQCIIPKIRALFPNCIIVNAERNGNDIIGSTYRKGWYSDEHLESSLVDYVERFGERNIPWYVPEPYRKAWVLEWDVITRSAFVWAFLMSVTDADISVKYEDLLSDPDTTIERVCNFCGLQETTLTQIHKETIRHVSHYPDFSREIQEPVKGFLKHTMEKHGYEFPT